MKELIDTILSDLLDESTNLETTFLKCQVLAYKLKSPNFKSWVNCELNGYESRENIPKYRCVETIVKGHLFQDLGFGGSRQMTDTVLPVHHLDSDYSEKISKYKFTERISQLQELSKSERNLEAELPYSFLQRISQHTGIFECIKARQILPTSAVIGIISSIKSKLITLILELKEEIGDKELPDMKQKKRIDEILEKTFGNIKADNVSISIGDKNIQTNNSGSQANIQSSSGNKSTNSINVNDIKVLLEKLKEQIEEIELPSETKIEVLDETKRIDKQLSKTNPSRKVIRQSADFIYDLITEVTASALSEPILSTIGQIISTL